MNNLKKRFVGTLVLVLMTLGTAIAQKKTAPNFLIILGDDISANSLGCYGAENKGTSPNIDKLANEGMLFTNMFVSEAICAPTRAELYTGLQPVKNGCFQNHKATNNGTKSVVHYLSELGYRVGLTGKRHFKPASVYPFEKVEGFPEDSNLRNISSEDWSGVEDFIDTETEKPFCLFICSVHAHSPWDSGDSSEWNMEDIKLPPHFVDNKETRLHFREYLAEVKLFDTQVGRAMKMLKSRNLDQNTVVIVLDENGAGMPGGKWTNHDWGVRSACLMRWPGNISPGLKTNAIAQYCDILPTMIDAAGGKVPADLDGKSLLKLVNGQTKEHRKNAFFVYNNEPAGPAFPSRAVIDDKYKLIWNLMPENKVASNTINGFDFGFEDHMLDRPERFMYLSWLQLAKTDSIAQNKVDRYRSPKEFELFNLDDDPWEMTNLAYEEEYQQVLIDLKGKIELWMESQGDEGKSIDVNRS